MPRGSATDSETVLLVDDDEAVRQYVGYILRRYGYRVLEASGGAEALHLCTQHEGPIHLLLTDIQMLDMTGPELAPRALVLRPHLQVLYMSAQFSEDVLSQLEGQPLQPFIQKPFTSEALVHTIRHLLGPSDSGPC
ncbi:MAG: response regulator [Nitrospirota bacterium]|nr:response regulator [Nitrospirota bacterium]MDE3036329.1 response regulator [Nitrospirota bacterium]MDE3118556.1 response regulator [Nitrospirota bacterium]MDE3224092.1 response regulator [Nitrospirota bacterium]MDE3243235.1 response regulator [Nitrospirota bacterium]